MKGEEIETPVVDEAKKKALLEAVEVDDTRAMVRIVLDMIKSDPVLKREFIRGLPFRPDPMYSEQLNRLCDYVCIEIDRLDRATYKLFLYLKRCRMTSERALASCDIVLYEDIVKENTSTQFTEYYHDVSVSMNGVVRCLKRLFKPIGYVTIPELQMMASNIDVIGQRFEDRAKALETGGEVPKPISQVPPTKEEMERLQEKEGKKPEPESERDPAAEVLEDVVKEEATIEGAEDVPAENEDDPLAAAFAGVPPQAEWGPPTPHKRGVK